MRVLTKEAIRLGVLLVSMATPMVLLPATALADCPQTSPWPSFTRSAGAAPRIIIGTVTSTPGGEVNNHFTLHVDEVLRGTSPETLEFKAFRSGAPQPICPEDSSLLVHQVGDRLAFAYGARLPGLDHPITAVAFVVPPEVDPALNPRMEQLSEEQVRAIAELPATDREVPPTSDGASLLIVSAGLGLLVATFLARRRRSAFSS